jgi:DNA-binding MltR family transcriptional regulator
MTKKASKRPFKKPPTSKEFDAAIKELDTDGPRGCAVLAHALLETIMERLLRSRMVPLLEREEGELFKGTAPLATMSARVRLAYSLGIIDGQTRDYLNIVSLIRNKLAHTDVVKTFETPEVAHECKKLFPHAVWAKDSEPRQLYIRSVKMLMITLMNLYVLDEDKT